MSINLVSFVGSRDPYNREGLPGPLLSTLERLNKVDFVLLFGTVDFQEKVESTKRVLVERGLEVEVEILDVDPTNHSQVLTVVEPHLRCLPPGDVIVCLTSGTPAIHAVLLLLSYRHGWNAVYLSDRGDFRLIDVASLF